MIGLVEYRGVLMFWTTVKRNGILCLFFGCLALVCGAGPFPTTAPASIELKGIDGKSYTPLAVAPATGAVLIFVLQDCPICNAYAPQIERLAQRYRPKGFEFYLVHVDSTLSDADAQKHAKDYDYHIPVLIDRHHDLVKALQIAVAPTAVVVGADGNVEYKGRIDDQYSSIGRQRTVTSTHELRDAIAAVAEGKPVEHPRTPTIGCAVPEVPAR
jgi:thiol-disulfide isomerase/thioredoxin